MRRVLSSVVSLRCGVIVLHVVAVVRRWASLCCVGYGALARHVRSVVRR